uniref:Uncharacterized protein n=1 Tax=viral metagenome TaxID=1070528 RepID=A0A6C0C0J4_9ZZZZ
MAKAPTAQAQAERILALLDKLRESGGEENKKLDDNPVETVDSSSDEGDAVIPTPVTPVGVGDAGIQAPVSPVASPSLITLTPRKYHSLPCENQL